VRRLRRAFRAFEDSEVLTEMRQAAMARDFSWSGAAAEYERLYARLIDRAQVMPMPARQQSWPAAQLAAGA
jgi:glycogen synthase